MCDHKDARQHVGQHVRQYVNCWCRGARACNNTWALAHARACALMPRQAARGARPRTAGRYYLHARLRARHAGCVGAIG
eukprot:10515677-Alexandrium_andersonii.AAC.1